MELLEILVYIGKIGTIASLNECRVKFEDWEETIGFHDEELMKIDNEEFETEQFEEWEEYDEK